MKSNKTIGLCMLAALMIFWVGCGGPKELDDENKIRLLYDAGVGYINQGEPEKAINSFKEALSINPSYPQVLQGLGLAYWQLGVPETAIIWFRKTIEITPDDSVVNNNMAGLCNTLGNYEQAIIHSTKAIDDPEYRTPTAAFFNRGTAKLHLGDLDGAEKDLRSAMRLDPMYDLPRLELARLNHNKGNYDQAIRLATSVIKLKNDNAEAYLLRGQSYWERGLVTKAEHDFIAITQLKNAAPEYIKKAHDWLDRIQ